jgi:hypothetical protein
VRIEGLLIKINHAISENIDVESYFSGGRGIDREPAVVVYHNYKY